MEPKLLLEPKIEYFYYYPMLKSIFHVMGSHDIKSSSFYPKPKL
jgi:hypothetical protein